MKRYFTGILFSLISLACYSQNDFGHEAKSMEIYAGQIRIFDHRSLPIDFIGFNYSLNENWKLRSNFHYYSSNGSLNNPKRTSKTRHPELSLGIQRDLLRNNSRRYYLYGLFDLGFAQTMDNLYDASNTKIRDGNYNRYLMYGGFGTGIWITKRIALNFESAYMYGLGTVRIEYYDQNIPTYRRGLYQIGHGILRYALTVKFRIR